MFEFARVGRGAHVSLWPADYQKDLGGGSNCTPLRIGACEMGPNLAPAALGYRGGDAWVPKVGRKDLGEWDFCR